MKMVSRENVVVNKGKLSLNNQKYGLNLQKKCDFIRKEFLNTDVKNTFECFKALLNYVKKNSQQRSK